MNKFRQAKGRTIRVGMKAAAKIIAGGYDSIAKEISGDLELRGKELYEEHLAVCRECSPNGRCPECNCNYTVKLVMRDFPCGKGKW